MSNPRDEMGSKGRGRAARSIQEPALKIMSYHCRRKASFLTILHTAREQTPACLPWPSFAVVCSALAYGFLVVTPCSSLEGPRRGTRDKSYVNEVYPGWPGGQGRKHVAIPPASWPVLCLCSGSWNSCPLSYTFLDHPPCVCWLFLALCPYCRSPS